MRKFNRILMKVSLLILCLCGAFGVIYDLFIWDKSVVPDWLFNLVFIIGIISLAVLIVTYSINEKQSKSKR